jgi:transcriptional regulator with XRE-family HTH domain
MAAQPPELFSLHVSEIAQKCKVSLKTAARWKSGQSVPPATALMILVRDLGCIHPDWKGWAISHRGELCSPENWIATPGAIRAMQFHRSQLSALREEILILKSQLTAEEVERYEEQPLPTQWEINWETAAG